VARIPVREVAASVFPTVWARRRTFPSGRC
jgi:hypothetical protein